LHQRTFLHGTPRARATQIAAVLVALLTFRLVAADLAALHRGAARFGGTHAVVVAVNDLELGSRVRSGDVKVVDVPSSAIPPGALARRDDAIGRVVAVPVLAGAAVADRALAQQPRDRVDGGGGRLDDIVTPGRRAVRVTTTDGLRPDPGSVVDVLATLDARDVGGTVEPTVVVARAARVLAVDPAPSSLRDAGTSETRVGVVILVTALEASHIADSTARGALMLALDPPEDACTADAPVSCRP
jgi:pilus assembly protein CpaB